MDNAFMTHNGLKVRLNQDYCLQYLKEEKVSPWSTSIEAFDSFSGFLSTIGAITLLLTHQDPIYSGIVIFALYLYGIFVSQSYFLMGAFNLIYGLIFMLYEKLTRLFVPSIALIVITVITKEYMIFIAYLIARFAGFVISNLYNFILGKLLFSKYGVYFGDVEITAIKLLAFYSDDNFEYKNWFNNYSNFIKTGTD